MSRIFSLSFSEVARKQLKKYKTDKALFAKINVALEQMKLDVKHPSLRAKAMYEHKCPHGKLIFECTVSQQKGGHRIFYCLDIDRPQTYHILSIDQHA